MGIFSNGQLLKNFLSVFRLFIRKQKKQNPTASAIGKSVGSVLCGGYRVVEPLFPGFIGRP